MVVGDLACEHVTEPCDDCGEADMIRAVRSRVASDDGFSIAEFAVASFLLLVIGTIAVSFFTGGNRYVGLSLSRTVAAEEARRVVEDAAQSLRNARPLARCAIPGTPLGSVSGSDPSRCQNIAELPFTLHSASNSSVCWYEYPRQVREDGTVVTDRLLPPALSCLGVTVDGGAAVMRRTWWNPTATATYTNPAWSQNNNPDRAKYVAKVQRFGELPYFSFFDATGTQIIPGSSGLTAQQLAQVRTVRLDAAVALTGTDPNIVAGRADTLSFTVSLRGSRYEREQVRW
jgi:hypothetical protein